MISRSFVRDLLYIIGRFEEQLEIKRMIGGVTTEPTFAEFIKFLKENDPK